MALRKRKVGVGGDHADWGAAYIWLQASDPLDADYEFRQISDCTVAAWGGGGILDMNYHTVRFYCPWADSHQGDPTKGYMTYINGIAMGVRDNTGGADRYEDVFKFEGLNIERIDASITPIGIWIQSQNVGSGTTGVIKDCIWRGNGNDRTIYITDSATQLNISNCKIANVNNAFRVVNKYNAARTIIENCSVDDCNEAGAYFDLITLVATFRNVTITNSPPNDCWQGSLSYLYNCADDDGSMVASGATLIDPQSNIVPADAFVSVDRTNPLWLKLPAGSASAKGSASPVRGKAPLEVQFNSTLNFNSDSILGQTGMRPTLQQTDISGNERPGDDNLYSIGAEEIQYEYD